MEFPLERLRRIGKKAFVIALAEAFGTFAIGFSVSFFILHFSLFDLAFVALAISVTSSNYYNESIRRVRHNQRRSILYNFTE